MQERIGLTPVATPVGTEVLQPVQTLKSKQQQQLTNLGLDAVNAVLGTVSNLEAQKGAMDALQGKEETAGSLFKSRALAFNKMKGQMTASGDYQRAVNEVLRRSATMTPDEFTRALQELTSKYANNAEGFDEGFYPTAAQINESALAAYTNAQADMFRLEVTNGANQQAYDKINNTVYTVLSNQFGITNLDSMTSEDYASLDQSGIPDITMSMLRESLTELQNEYKTLGLTKAEVSELFVNQVGTLAVKYGLPELLKFTELKDFTGISLSKTQLEGKILQFKSQAENVRASIGETLDKQAEIEYKAAIDRTEQDFSVAALDLVNIADPMERAKAAMAIKEQLTNNPLYYDMSNSTVNTVTKQLNDYINLDRTTVVESDPATYINMLNASASGQLKSQDILDAYTNGLLTETDYQYLAKQVSSTIKGEREYIFSTQGKAINATKDSVLQLLSSSLSYDVFGGANQAKITGLLEIATSDYLLQNKDDLGKISTTDYIKEVLDPLLLKEVGSTYSDILRDTKLSITGLEQPTVTPTTTKEMTTQLAQDVAAQKTAWYLKPLEWIGIKDTPEEQATEILETLPPQSFTVDQGIDYVYTKFIDEDAKVGDIRDALLSEGHTNEDVANYLFATGLAIAKDLEQTYEEIALYRPSEFTKRLQLQLASFGYTQEQINTIIANISF